MNNIYKSIILALITIFAMASCDPQDNDNNSLGTLDTITADQVSFSYKSTSKSDNVIAFTNTSDVKAPVSVLWSLGNGVESKQIDIVGEYPYAGDYTVTLTLSASDGTSISKSQVIHIEKNDFSLINTPAYRNLTGGSENTVGKTWVFDQYNNFTKEVAAALGTDIRGHMGLGPTDMLNQSYWGAGPNEKKTWTMYASKFNFVQNGTVLKIGTEGKGYGRTACAATIGGFNVTSLDGPDAIFDYTGGNYTFSINESGKYPKLTLSGNAFMGYYCGSQSYDILYQTDKVMALRTHNAPEKHDWIFIYCLEELNIAVAKKPKAIELSEDFEKDKASMVFEGEDIGSLFSQSYQNPAPVPINKSLKTCLYQKTSSFYSNIYYLAKDYKFDLSEINKVRMKVYLPTYNDYTTTFPIAGEWIKVNTLQAQVTVKLQDSEKGGSAWENQTEVTKVNIEKGKWLELEFDFSSVKDRKDYDKIVIQFGAEGHAAPGIFFFDDFKFSK